MKSLASMTTKMRRTLNLRGRSKEEAEDLVQEAFLRLTERSGSGEIREPEAYIRRAVINLSIDEHRARLRSPLGPFNGKEPNFVDPVPGPAEVFEARERLARMSAGLMKLSPRTRRILLAQRLEGLTYAEIAAKEAISVSAVEKQMARAMSFMLGWMADW